MDYKKEAKQLIELFFPVEEEDGVGETAKIAEDHVIDIAVEGMIECTSSTIAKAIRSLKER